MLSMKKSSLGIVGGIAFLLLANLAYARGPKVVSGAESCTSHTIFLFLDGTNLASAVTCTGKAHGKFGGPYQNQGTEGYVDSGQHCTMSSGHAGLLFTLYFAAGARTYTHHLDQLWWDGGSATDAGTPPTEGSYCFNPSNYKFEGTATYNITGGTGRFEGATGTITVKFHGGVLADGTLYGGSFAQIVNTSTSSITFK